MKILMAPVNLASQPITLIKELQRRGIDISLLQYTSGAGHKFGYETDKLVNVFGGVQRRKREIEILIQCLKENYDISRAIVPQKPAGRVHSCCQALNSRELTA